MSVLNIMGLRLEDGLPYYGGTSLRLETASPTTAGRAYDSRRPPLLLYGGTSSVFGGDSSFQLMPNLDSMVAATIWRGRGRRPLAHSFDVDRRDFCSLVIRKETPFSS